MTTTAIGDDVGVDDLVTVAPAFASGPAFFSAPFAGATWRAVAQGVIGFVWLLAAGITVFVLVVVATGLVPALGIGLPLLAGALLVARGFAAVERRRLAAQTGVVIGAPRYREARARGWWRLSVWWSVITDSRGWAHTLYAFVGMLLESVGYALTVALGGAAVAAVTFPIYGEGTTVAGWFSVSWPVLSVVAVLAGVVLAWLACLAALGTSLTLVRLARHLLGASARAEAIDDARAARAEAARSADRAVTLTETRTRAVGAADAERRRIERDLHDGAQQRLVALGVELGTARRAAARDPEAAAAALDHAHTEVKETLAELRDLVRGIHPAVLTDRGLDAALSALAARSPVPVAVDVDEPDDLAAASGAAQAAAYFVVAEALTNVTKHADARAVLVEVAVVEQRLRVEVSDDGRGGAVPTPGSGLDGLRSRVAALDGTLDVTSPAGGGTRLTVELPCAS